MPRSLPRILLLFLLFSPGTALAQVPPYVGSIGGSDVPVEYQLRQPVGVAVDVNGVLYVVDAQLLLLKKYTGTGAYLAQWAVSSPKGVAVAPAGDVYVQTLSTLEHYTSAGAWVWHWATTGLGPCTDSDGRVYTEWSCGVQKYASSSFLLGQWGTCGTGAGLQFSGPEGVAVDATGNMYVTDIVTDRVTKMTAGGVLVRHWGTQGGGPGQFNDPVRCAVGPDGRVYVVDNGNNRIQIFDPDGNYLGQWGSAGSGPGKFLNPIGIAVDANNNVYVADANNGRVQVFGTGTVIVPVPTRSGTWGRLKAIYR